MDHRVEHDLPTGAALETLRRAHSRAHIMATDPRLASLVRHGRHCVAYSTLESGLQHFLVRDIGYLAFRPIDRHHMVLGPPVADARARGSILEAFVRYSEDAGMAVLCVHADQDAAETARALGFSCHFLGVESAIALDGYALGGASKNHVRRSCNQARRARVEVREAARENELEEPGEAAAEQAISRAWLRARKRDALTFLVRPFRPGPELDVRTFHGFVDQRMVGFVRFDPLYHQGRIVGYYQQHTRAAAHAPRGTLDLVTVTALERFQGEGLETLHLGLSPFAASERYLDGPHQRRYARIVRTIFEGGGGHYPFRGNYFHKSRYRGAETPAFLLEYPAARTGNLRVLARAMGMVPTAFIA